MRPTSSSSSSSSMSPSDQPRATRLTCSSWFIKLKFAALVAATMLLVCSMSAATSTSTTNDDHLEKLKIFNNSQQAASPASACNTMNGLNNDEEINLERSGSGNEVGVGVDAKAQVEAEVEEVKAPIIAVITQLFRDYRNFFPYRALHLPSSYVKWLEASGAQVLPVFLNQSDTYYEQVFASSQGLLFPGGDNLLDPRRATPMLEAARKLYRLALESNDRGQFYPIWGTCLGMELLTVLGSNQNTLVNCQAEDRNYRTKISRFGRLFAAGDGGAGKGRRRRNNHETHYTRYIMSLLQETNITYHFHHKCITNSSLRQAKLDQFYEPLAYTRDDQGLEFVSIFEARQYPFYGVQFHPEKPPFEHRNQLKSQKFIPHSPQAIQVSRYFADFFISQAKKSRKPMTITSNQLQTKLLLEDDRHSSSRRKILQKTSQDLRNQSVVHNNESSSGLPVKEDLESRLIYNHCPVYLAPRGDMYEQRYVWPFVSGTFELDLGEFVDRPLADGESVSEELVVDGS